MPGPADVAGTIARFRDGSVCNEVIGTYEKECDNAGGKDDASRDRRRRLRRLEQFAPAQKLFQLYAQQRRDGVAQRLHASGLRRLAHLGWARLTLSKASMKARPRFTQRRWARTRSEIAPTTSPINSPSLPARHDRAQHDGGSSMSCFRIRRLTTLPQHVDRGPQRCASLDGMYSISSCSKSLSAAPYFLVAGSPTGTSAIGEPTVLAGCRAPSLNSKRATTFDRQVRRRFALTRNMPAR
jgi:hypothetical protein